MNRLNRTLTGAFVAVTALGGFAPWPAFAQTVPVYAVADLGKGVTPYAVNDLGQVVGQSSSSSCFLWTPSVANGASGTFTYIAPGIVIRPKAIINAAGKIVGTFDTGVKNAAGYPIYHPFLWTPDVPNGTVGTFADLNNTVPAGSGWTLTQGHDINNAGKIVGTGTYVDPQTGATYSDVDFGWERDAAGIVTVTRLDLGPSDNENPSALNNLNPPQVAGSVKASSTSTSAFVCQANMPRIALGQLGAGPTQAYKINDGGQVVGVSSTMAFLWTPGGTNGVLANPQMQNLQPASGVQQSKAFSVNNSGLVVGGAIYSSNTEYFGFSWNSAYGWYDLNSVSTRPANCQLQIARGCNNRTVNGLPAAQIVVSGYVKVTTTTIVRNKTTTTTTNEAHGFLLTP